MCFHSKEEADAYFRKYRMRVVNKSVVIMRHPTTGEFEEAYLCDASDPQDIANTIRNLRAWHPGDKIVDLTQCNADRQTRGLDWLEEKDLPLPTGVAPPSEDVIADLVQANEDVNPALKNLKFEPPPKEPTQEELVAAYDAAQAKRREEMLAKRPKPDAAPAVDLTKVSDREFINALARA